MLAIRLPLDIEKRLAALAQKTGRTKSFYVREAFCGMSTIWRTTIWRRVGLSAAANGRR
jgi:predicted transcriptional regulator